MKFLETAQLRKCLEEGERPSISGLAGSAISLITAELVSPGKPVILFTDSGRARKRYEEISSLVRGANVSLLDSENRLFDRDFGVLVTSQQYLELVAHQRVIEQYRKGDTLSPEALVDHLFTSGYTLEDTVEEEGEFARRGGIVDVFVEGSPHPYRLEFLGDELISLRSFDPQTQRSIAHLATVTLAFTSAGALQLESQLPKSAIIVFEEPAQDQRFAGWLGVEVRESGGAIDFDLSPVPLYFGNINELRNDVEKSGLEYHLMISSPNVMERIYSSLPPRVKVTSGFLHEGFAARSNGFVLLTEYELFGRLPTRPRRSRFKGLFIDDLLGLKKGDYVVHEEFGIGQFEGLKILKYEAGQQECLVITYSGGDRVYIPVEKLNLVERYVGGEDRPPRLSKLGREIWFRNRAKVKHATELLAVELLKLYAERAASRGYSFSDDAEAMSSLEMSFGYDETPDQRNAISDVQRDMESDRPMDRLICGDVGFGKTEVAIRAALRAVLDKKQVCLVAPTTLLAFQHYRTFTDRLRNFPITVEMLSRFRPRVEQKKVVADLVESKVDIVVGTHRLLQDDIQFKDLGLLVIDEEQRFGVMQKERIRSKRTEVDTLSLSATPIPRTLYMALSGIRDVSVIHSPPVGRKSIVTRVLEWNDEEIRAALLFEKRRGGQVFFVHNRIETIFNIFERIRNLLPDITICVLHGQMRSAKIEKGMIQFLEGKFDVLLSTAIVESGLDLPRVNTIIINQADRLGLADLHQLRGRVGRSPTQAYAYFVIPEEEKITPDAKKRLGAIMTYTSLGSGFRLAIRDMETRGVGNLLGKEQHGFVNLVGYHLYLRLLSEAVDSLKGKTVRREPVLDLKIDAFIPRDYVADQFERIALYKRLMQALDLPEVDTLIDELCDRFGAIPNVIENLFELARIRIQAKNKQIESVTRSGDKFVVKLDRQKIEIEGFRQLLKFLGLERPSGT